MLLHVGIPYALAYVSQTLTSARTMNRLVDIALHHSLLPGPTALLARYTEMMRESSMSRQDEPVDAANNAADTAQAERAVADVIA